MRRIRHGITYSSCAASYFLKIQGFPALPFVVAFCLSMGSTSILLGQGQEEEERYRITYENTQAGNTLSVTNTQQDDGVVENAVRRRRNIVSTLPYGRSELIRIKYVQGALELSKQQIERLPLIIKEITEAEQKLSKAYLKNQATKDELMAFVVAKRDSIATFLSDVQNEKLDAIVRTVLLHKFGPEALLTSSEFTSVDLSDAQRDQLKESIKEFEEIAKAKLQEIYWLHTMEALELTLTSEQKTTLKEIVRPQAIDWIILQEHEGETSTLVEH